MNHKRSKLGAVARQPDQEGMIYSPEHGQVAFTVPLFDEFMRREMSLP